VKTGRPRVQQEVNQSALRALASACERTRSHEQRLHAQPGKESAQGQDIAPRARGALGTWGRLGTGEKCRNLKHWVQWPMGRDAVGTWHMSEMNSQPPGNAHGKAREDQGSGGNVGVRRGRDSMNGDRSGTSSPRVEPRAAARGSGESREHLDRRAKQWEAAKPQSEHAHGPSILECRIQIRGTGPRGNYSQFQ